MNDQPEFDFVRAERERPLAEHWARLEALAAAEFSEPNLCLAWITASDGRAWREWWDGLPCYDRERYLAAYREERAIAVDRPMIPFAEYVRRCTPSAEELAQDRAIVDRFVAEIKAAALERRPMPLADSDDMTPAERMTFRLRLATAMNIAGVVIVEARPAEEKRGRKKKTDK